jgi:light-regulated signal transduction histidine kinase (bacteriophytochrome)
MTADPDDLKSVRSAAEEATRELESLTYSISHDLRAPLRSIEGFSQALMEDCADQLNADGKRYLQYIRESTQRMTQLIDGLLTLSRVSRGDLVRVPLNLSALARDILNRLRSTEPARPVESLVQEDILANADAQLMATALEHLLGNAWKFTSKQPAAQIEFGTLPAQQPTVYFIRDNGAGFDMRYAGKLFGMFQRLHSIEDFPGTGVGLGIAHRIVRRHGGRIWGEAEPDHGATFYFTLNDLG